MLTKEQALTADEFHYGECSRKVGPRGGVTRHTVVWRRNGQTKTWKTRPNDFQVPVKYGFRGPFDYISQDDVESFHAASECPLEDSNG